MSMRLQEIHPAVVHFPIALLPTSLVADALGRISGSETLMEIGRRTAPVALAGAVAAGVTGLIAQQTVKLPGNTVEMLITHRNINLGVTGILAALVRRRLRSRRPTLGYLAAGFAGLAAVTYSAYLGGHMVYEHGVGVLPADGVDTDAAPVIEPDDAAAVTRLSGKHLREGVAMTARELGQGKVAPYLRQTASTTAEPV